MSTTKFCPVAQWTRVTHLFERTRGQTAAAAAAFLWRPAIDLFFSCFDYECCVSNWRKWRDLFCKLRISGERNGERLRPNRSLPNCQKNKPNVRHALAFVSINLLIRGKSKCLGRQLLWPFSILGAFYQVLKALSLWQQEPFQQGGELSVVYPLFRWPSLKRFLRPRLEYCCKCILKPLRFLQIPPRRPASYLWPFTVWTWSVGLFLLALVHVLPVVFSRSTAAEPENLDGLFSPLVWRSHDLCGYGICSIFFWRRRVLFV